MSKILALSASLKRGSRNGRSAFGKGGFSYRSQSYSDPGIGIIEAPGYDDGYRAFAHEPSRAFTKQAIDVSAVLTPLAANTTLFPRGLNAGQRGGIGDIINFWNTQQALTDVRWLAYMLGTAKHESAHTMRAVRETLASTDEGAIRGVSNYILRVNNTRDADNVTKAAAFTAVHPAATPYVSGTTLTAIPSGAALAVMDTFMTNQNAEVSTRNAVIDTINREIDAFNATQPAPNRKAKLSRWSMNYAALDPVTRKSYYGRGIVQLTHKSNYVSMAGLLSIPTLGTDPELALDPANSVQILFKGMVDGTFRSSRGTPIKLSDFFNATTEDWVGARGIVNGIVPRTAETIGNESRQFLLSLTNQSAAHSLSYYGSSQQSYNTGEFSEAYDTPQQRFINAWATHAVASMRASRVPASVTLAQAALESGWGRSAPENNFFGIKAGNWTGRTQLLRTREVHPSNDPAYRRYPEVISIEPYESAANHRRDRQNRLLYRWTVRDRFRAYDTATDCFNDHARLFTTLPRYAAAMRVANDGLQFAREIAAAGYATDPTYAATLVSIINSHNLTRFDH